MKLRHNNIIALIIIILLGVFFQKSYINEFPSHIHAWAQSDRYALAHGFVNNDLNLFKPETFLYNHQFPHNWEVPSKESITAVDFPIHDYVPAIFMKLLKTTSPWVFRVYILLYSFIGLFYLFKLAKLLTSDFYKSTFITLFAATSPVFVYYQGGFLPTIPSLANAFIGIYFYANYLSTTKNKDFNLSILFLTLGALSRTTFAIPLLAVLGLEFLRVIQKKASLKPKLIPVLVSFFMLMFFFFYNGFMREKYGSEFLNYILPATSTEQVFEIFKLVKEQWMMHYFSIIHYIVLICTFSFALLMLASKKVKLSKEASIVLFLIAILFIACIIFAFLMLRQFPAHDYYFLDTFFLPIILLFIIILSAIPSFKVKWIKGICLVITLIISVSMVSNANDMQKSRRITGSWDRTSATINNFKDADKFLDSLKIPKHSKILVLDAYAPNIPFILMNRKGYVVMKTTRKNIQNALKWNYDYIITQNEFFLSDIYSSYPEIISKITKIWDNGRISICKLNAIEKDKTLNEYLGLDKKTPLRIEKMDYDTLVNEFWQHTDSTTEFCFSGKKAGILTQDMPFGLTYSTKVFPEIKNKSSLLVFQSYFLHDSNTNFELVVSVNENGENIYYKTYNLQDLLKIKNKWEKVNLIFQLPKVNSNDYEFAIYIWNTGKAKLYLDDFEFKIY